MKRRTLLGAMAAAFLPMPKVPFAAVAPTPPEDEGPSAEELIRQDMERGFAEAFDRMYWKNAP